MTTTAITNALRDAGLTAMVSVHRGALEVRVVGVEPGGEDAIWELINTVCDDFYLIDSEDRTSWWDGPALELRHSVNITEGYA